MDWMVPRLLHDVGDVLPVAYQPRIRGRPPQDNIIIHTAACANVCFQSEAVCLLYSSSWFMHSSSPVFKYRQRWYGLNSLQATTCSPGSIPTNNNNVYHALWYSLDWCKHMFTIIKLLICSIHLCIHHDYLDPNTEKDNMDWMVSRLQHDDDDALLVAYQLIIIIMCSTPVEFIQPMQTCIQCEAVDLLYSFIHPPSSHGLKKYKRR